MKITDRTVETFEENQKEYGTKAALFTIIFTICDDLMRDLGVAMKPIAKKKE